MKKTLEDQQIKFEMLSNSVNTFVADTNEQSIPMTTTMILVKSIQGIPYSRVLKVLFNSDGSASMISRKVSS